MVDPAPGTPVPPDTKDWTWVLERPCPDCGFATAELDVATVPDRVRGVAARFTELLADPRARTRPHAEQWSALEYACHVRDVFRLFDVRLGLMLDSDDPLFANWDQDETALTDDYGSQDPGVVGAELVAAGERVAASFAAVDGDQWGRRGRRSDGAAFTVDSFARYFLHDPVHHVWDVEQGYAALG